MSLTQYEPQNVFNTLSQELDRWFDGGPGVRAWSPAADISETDAEYLVRVDVPGIEPDKIDVRVEKGVLTVQGERQTHIDNNGRYTRVERASGKFARQFRLPDVADDQSIEADYRHGVLTVQIAKKETSQPRQIEVRVN